MIFRKLPDNPLISPRDLEPTRPDFEVYGIFNCAAAKIDGEYRLLLRVAEKPVEEPGWVFVPVLNEACDGIEVLHFRADGPEVIEANPRTLTLSGGRILLRSISHLRLARSSDGLDFTVQDEPALFPQTPFERFGIEDPRVTHLDGRWWVSYTAVSAMGITAALASTRDWQSFERHGIIFGPDNKDVAILPEKVGGLYACRHRPWSQGIGEAGLWTASSPDLLHWGRHARLIAPRAGNWDGERVGAGPPPIRTRRGWLDLYHGAGPEGRYCMGALVTDLEDPTRVLARSTDPVLEPTEPYETTGVYAPVVFACGAVAEPDGALRLYYGAADTSVCCATAGVEDLLSSAS